MNVRWDVFKCPSCPPDVDKRWDIALLAEHHAIAHMNNFHLFECPVCNKKLATILAAQFHIRKCVKDDTVDVSAYARNLLAVPPKMFVDLHVATLNAFKAYLVEQKAVSADSQTQTDGDATAEPKPDALDTVIALLGGKSDRVETSGSKEKMAKMWTTFTTATAEDKTDGTGNGEKEQAGHDEYEEISHDDTLESTIVGADDGSLPPTPGPSAPVLAQSRASPPVVRDNAETPPHIAPTRSSLEFGALGEIPLPSGIPGSQPKALPPPTATISHHPRVQSVVPQFRTNRQLFTDRKEKNHGAPSSIRQDAQKVVVAPPNVDQIDHGTQPDAPIRMTGGADSAHHPKNVPPVGSGSSSQKQSSPKKRLEEPPSAVPEASQSRHSIVEVEPTSRPVPSKWFPSLGEATWRLLPMERSKPVSWSSKLDECRRRDEAKAKEAQRKREHPGDYFTEFKIPFKKPLLSNDGVPKLPESNNGFRAPFPMPPNIVDPRRRPLGPGESSVPSRAETRATIAHPRASESFAHPRALPEFRTPYQRETRPSGNPNSAPSTSADSFPARALSVMPHFLAPRYQTNRNYFITPPGMEDPRVRRSQSRLTTRPEMPFTSPTELTDVTITIPHPNGTEMKFYFSSQYLMKFSSFFTVKFSLNPTPAMKFLALNEHGIAFLYAMCAYHLKPVPLTPKCDYTGHTTIFKGELLTTACDIIERYDLNGAMDQIAQLLFTSRCYPVAPQNTCPSCVDRVAIALKFKMPIPGSLKFTKAAIDGWLTMPTKKNLSKRMGNDAEVCAFLKSREDSTGNM